MTETTTLTSEAALWAELRDMIRLDPDAWQVLRREAVERLTPMAREYECGISSSDVNHTAVAILRERRADALAAMALAEAEWERRTEATNR